MLLGIWRGIFGAEGRGLEFEKGDRENEGVFFFFQ